MTWRQKLRTFERVWVRPLLSCFRKSKRKVPSAEELQGREAWSKSQWENPVLQPKETDFRLGLISPLPPLATGIANFSIAYFPSCGWHLDLYGGGSLQDLIQHQASFSEGRVRIFPEEAFGEAGVREKYDAAILQMGNGPHHLSSLQAWQKALPHLNAKKWIYLHEAQLLRLWKEMVTHPLELEDFYRNYYPDRHFNLEDLYSPNSQESLVPRGIRPLVSLANPDLVIVNSAFCKMLVEQDLDGWTSAPSVEIRQLFHPIPQFSLPFSVNQKQKEEPLRIGHFGNAGGEKSLALVFRAMEMLRDRKAVTFVLAGFGVGRVVARHGLNRHAWVEVHDSPSHPELLRLMASVDGAIQLRFPSQGESSGVVNQLLGMGKPIIVTSVGAFAELGSAVFPVSPTVEAEELAHVIQEMLEKRDAGAIREIQIRYGLDAFQQTLADWAKD
ncbi:glycosyltransferase [Geothrix sp. 21YS21S-4]|uniref:glycosyltransferase n=1 Tax=Geothrix sp. 21YS21S-4 TaxID=3068889 RepID=UPI0027BA2013|nr:glycosyltransferase [Geothrix sp. 21YS21S-4]